MAGHVGCVPSQKKKRSALDMFPELPQVDVLQLGRIVRDGGRDRSVIVQLVLELGVCDHPQRHGPKVNISRLGDDEPGWMTCGLPASMGRT